VIISFETITKFWKKRLKGKRYWMIVIISVYLIFSFGQFLENSSSFKRFNIFTILFGSKSVEIDSTYISKTTEDNKTFVQMRITNDGDKDVNDLFLYYDFCEEGIKKVSLPETKLGMSEKQYFWIEVNSLNFSCNPSTTPAKIILYLDKDEKCYTDVESPISEVCAFCPIQFYTYDAKGGGSIKNTTVYYPYSEKNVSTLELIRKYMTYWNFDIKFVLNENNKEYSLKSDCLIILNKDIINKIPLRKVSTLTEMVLIDPYTYCLQEDDPKFCMEYFSK